MTTYENQLVGMIESRCGELSAREVARKLIRMGVVDFSRCRILAVREYVRERTERGAGKTDAMWEAAERFACSYEYVRKCVYNYRDVNWE